MPLKIIELNEYTSKTNSNNVFNTEEQSGILKQLRILILFYGFYNFYVKDMTFDIVATSLLNKFQKYTKVKKVKRKFPEHKITNHAL